MIGGVTTQRARTRKKRVPLLRVFSGTHRAGVIALARGGWVKTAGEDDRRRDESLRLVRNIGDALIVMADDVSYAVVTRVEAGWNEKWHVHVVHGPAIPDGEVMVMAARRAK